MTIKVLYAKFQLNGSMLKGVMAMNTQAMPKGEMVYKVCL